MSKTVIDLVAGARPNFMKLAPVERAFQTSGSLATRIVHTGQHYDTQLSDVFFTELGIPRPDICLEVGSGTHGAQTARILERYEAHLLENRTAAVVVFGDVNSTVACALAAVKLGIPVIHVEAGLRSFDRTMPEEINRLLTDALSDLLLVSEPSGVANLLREGIPESRIHLVGNVMIDTLKAELDRSRDSDVLSRNGLESGEYALVTLHRPSNVDDPAILGPLLHAIAHISHRLPVLFPVHPRTRASIQKSGLDQFFSCSPTLHVVDPLPYRDNLAAMASASMVITDSGGIQEETSILRVPCLTMRANTERPVTVEMGTSRLLGSDPLAMKEAAETVLDGKWKTGTDIPLWDGQAAERVAACVLKWISDRNPGNPR